MAGQGYYEFQPESILTATQVNDYLMDQTVMRATNVGTLDGQLGANRAAGMMGFFLEDSGGNALNRPHFYDGTSWNRLATKGEVDAQENRTGQVLLYMEVIN